MATANFRGEFTGHPLGFTMQPIAGAYPVPGESHLDTPEREVHGISRVPALSRCAPTSPGPAHTNRGATITARSAELTTGVAPASKATTVSQAWAPPEPLRRFMVAAAEASGAVVAEAESMLAVAGDNVM